jgi:hypothetical protein
MHAFNYPPDIIFCNDTFGGVSMQSPRNTSLFAKPTMNASVDRLDQHKQRLREIAESGQTTPG